MYEIKKFIQSHCLLWLLAFFFVLGIAFYLYGGRQDLPSDGNGTQPVRNELESASDDSKRVQERIGAAERTADGIEKSVERSGQLAGETAGIITECQQLIGTIRRRAEENTGAN